MSTHYDFNETLYGDAIASIEVHYFNDGWEIKGLAFGDETDEIGDTTVVRASREFKSKDIENAIDVFISDISAYIVCEVVDRYDDTYLVVFQMFRRVFMEKWSERVWAKFRADMNDTICPECGKRMAHSVAGRTLSDIGRIEQFFCEECGYVWVGYPSGKFIRDGVLAPSEWEIPR